MYLWYSCWISDLLVEGGLLLLNMSCTDINPLTPELLILESYDSLKKLCIWQIYFCLPFLFYEVQSRMLNFEQFEVANCRWCFTLPFRTYFWTLVSISRAKHITCSKNIYGMRGTMTLNVSSQLPRPLFENCDNIRASRYFTLHMLTCARCKFSPCFSQHSEACLSIFPHPRNFERRLQTRLRRRGPSDVPASGRIRTLCVRNATGFSGFTHLTAKLQQQTSKLHLFQNVVRGFW